MSALLKKLRIDPYLVLLLLTVALASILPVRGVGAEIFDYVVTAAIALLFFLYGAKLSPKAVGQGLLHWRLQSIVFLSTYLLFPALGVAIYIVMAGHLPSELLTGILFLTLLPSTVQSSIAFTSIARGNVAAALTSASFSNLVGVVITPLLAALVIETHGPGLNLDSIVKIALQILLPFVVGQLCRPLIGDLVKRHPKQTLVVDRGSILLVVYAAFSKGMVAGVWSGIDLADLAIVTGLCVLLLAVVMGVTALLGKLFGFSREDRIAIIFCGSKKSLASGVPMAGILFAGQAVSMVVLPVMIFHQIQLFACAILAQRFARDPDVTEATNPDGVRAAPAHSPA